VGGGILLQLDSLQEEEEGLRFRLRSWRVNAGAEPLGVTILFIPLSASPHKLETDWAGDCDKISLPQCPVCDQGSIVGHGRRRKQEKALPNLKDSNRLPDPSTLRRWSSGLDLSQPALSFAPQVIAQIAHWVARGDPANHAAEPLSWLTPVLPILWPLRL
jgi:hypothetical protein